MNTNYVLISNIIQEKHWVNHKRFRPQVRAPIIAKQNQQQVKMINYRNKLNLQKNKTRSLHAPIRAKTIPKPSDKPQFKSNSSITKPSIVI